MGCECYPPPPTKPLPFVFPAFNLNAVSNLIAFTHHISNPGKIGLGPVGPIPSYVSKVFNNCNFGNAVAITIDPPPGYPGPGLVQATATMTVDTVGNVTVTMTDTGSGYSIGSNYSVNFTLAGFNTINVKAGSSAYMQFPVANLAGPIISGWPNITLASAKVIPQLCGTLDITTLDGSPFTIRGKWYKNGVQIGSTMQLQVTSEGKKKIVHYCPPETFLYGDGLNYQLTSSADNMIDFTGDVLYYIQYT